MTNHHTNFGCGAENCESNLGADRVTTPARQSMAHVRNHTGPISFNALTASPLAVVSPLYRTKIRGTIACE